MKIEENHHFRGYRAKGKFFTCEWRKTLGGAERDVIRIEDLKKDLGNYRLRQRLDGQWQFAIHTKAGLTIGMSMPYTTKQSAQRAMKRAAA